MSIITEINLMESRRTNILSGSGLMPSGNKPLPEQMLTQNSTMIYGITRAQWVNPMHFGAMCNRGWTYPIAKFSSKLRLVYFEKWKILKIRQLKKFGYINPLYIRYHWVWHYHISHEHNKLVSQMRAPLAACREPAGKLWQLCKVLYVFEHKAQYLLIHAPINRNVIFWHIGNVPPMIS